MLTLETMKTLYFDCFSGISGDMTIGALLDLGLGFDYLKTELRKLPVEGYELQMSRVTRSNLSAMKFDVVMEGEEHEHHDHDHHDHHDHEHHHVEQDHHHEQEHTHGHSHEHGQGHAHFHRRASEILKMISDSKLRPNAKRLATEIFTK